MPSVDDIGSDERRHDKQRDRIKEHEDVPPEDVDSFLSFDEDLDYRDRALLTRITYLSKLKTHSVYADRPISGIEDKSEAERILKGYASANDSAPSTAQTASKVFSSYFGWLGRDWSEDIDRPDVDRRKVSPDEIYTEDDYQAMLDAAEHPRNKALVAVFWDTGLRVKALGTLRLQDIEVYDEYAVISLNEDAIGLKGAEGQFPLVSSKPYVANWLDVHPARDDDSAPLWHKLKMCGDDGRAMAHNTIYKTITGLAEDAGVSEPIDLKNFRHSSVARMKLGDYNESEIKYKHAWSERSDMLDVYGAFEDEGMIESILSRRGIIESDEAADESGPSRCPQCGVALEGFESYCPECATALSESASEKRRRAREKTFDEGVEAERRGTADSIREVQSRLEDDPELASAILDALDEHQSS